MPSPPRSAQPATSSGTTFSNPIFFEADVPVTPGDGRSKGYEPKIPLPASKAAAPVAALPTHGDLFDLDAAPSGGADVFDLKELKAMPEWTSQRPYLSNSYNLLTVRYRQDDIYNYDTHPLFRFIVCALACILRS